MENDTKPQRTRMIGNYVIGMQSFIIKIRKDVRIWNVWKSEIGNSRTIRGESSDQNIGER